MSNAQILSELKPIFSVVFDDDALVPTPEMTADDVEDWNSISHIQLMVAIEDFFGVHLRTGEVTAVENVGDLVNLIARRRAEA